MMNLIKFQIPEYGIAKFHIPELRRKLGSANKKREDQAMKRIQKFLRKPQSDQFLKPEFANGTHPYSGHCYVASQSLYHMLGGEEGGYSAYQMEHEGVSHWFLKNSKGRILDPTWRQFKAKPDYSQARRSAFLWTEDGISDRAEAMTALVGSPNKPSFVVDSVGKGIRVLNHPDIVKNFKKSLRVRKKNRKAVLIPCASTKPFPQSPSHKHGYLKALQGKNIDIYIVSEPLGIVPYSWSNTYPNNDYDFPPKFVQGESREILVDRFRQWHEKVGKKYGEIYLALPSHHFSLVEEAGIPGVDLSISACRKQYCSDKVFRATTDEYIDFLKSNITP